MQHRLGPPAPALSGDWNPGITVAIACSLALTAAGLAIRRESRRALVLGARLVLLAVAALTAGAEVPPTTSLLLAFVLDAAFVGAKAAFARGGYEVGSHSSCTTEVEKLLQRALEELLRQETPGTRHGLHRAVRLLVRQLFDHRKN